MPVRSVATAGLTADELLAIRALMDAAFDDFSDDDADGT